MLQVGQHDAGSLRHVERPTVHDELPEAVELPAHHAAPDGRRAAHQPALPLVLALAIVE